MRSDLPGATISYFSCKVIKRTTGIHRQVAALTFMLLGGCGGSPRTSPNSVSVDSVQSEGRIAIAPPAAKPESTTSPCPHTGRWARCSVENRLRQAGLVLRPVKGESQQRAGFSVRPVVYTLAGARLEVFLYSDEAALTRDIARMDTVRVAPIGSPSAWEMTPHFIRSGNLAAVFLTQNQRQAERLALALTAGAPQPGSPR